MSDYSPGPVEDDEVLIRTVYSPVQINQETGDVDPAFFRDVRERGLSVNRKKHISKEDLERQIQKKIDDDKNAGKSTNGFWRVITVECREIRLLTSMLSDGGKRAFCVYDSALPHDSSHADVCQADELPPKTANRRAIEKKVRSQIFEVFTTEAVELSQVY